MSETQNVEVIETPVAPVEHTYTYQPTDESGRPIGGKQVIKYTTQEELLSKLQEQNILLIRKLREQTKKVRLGIDEKEEISEDAQKFTEPIEFNPHELTDDERYDIARRLADPVTSAQAAQELVEASVGAPLSSLGKTLQTIQQENINLRAKIEVNSFLNDTPEYYRCPENFESITSWMIRYDLAPVKENFSKAYYTLKAQGLLIEGPAPVQAEPVVPVQTEPVIAVIPVAPIADEPVIYSRVPSGITREMASDSGQPLQIGDEITYSIGGRVLKGLQAIAAMPGDEYGRRLRTDRNFAKAVDKLEAEARKPRS